ncbi:DUF6088 family protein [Stygiobacter electus]|uniref:DUF6088 family protein n=1 Tax=Stygiobacter electus TaxID=3032292 RepID=A0AAE3P3P5_9BACT|nr:DUF6088 family protein [Stygiobacter electus]MDF1612295.1 DUF6088 family protein [Stygiobacter electus]
MTQLIENKILTKMKKAKRGTLFFVDNFISFGSQKAVSKALQRLVAKGEIYRVAPGIFVRPEIDQVIGIIMPTVDKIAVAIAKRDRARIVPTGVYALNKLGLSTQVPMNIVYLTDGSPRKVKLNKNVITFKKTSPKNVAALGNISKLVIQALKTIGQKNVDEQTIKHLQTLLKKENINYLDHDIRLAPEWIRKIMRPVLNEVKNEQ